MRAIGVIPARYQASRFPGKVLQKIGGRPMIELVYKEAGKAALLDDLIVATDDNRILKAVEKFGGKTVLTKKKHKTGTDRIAEAVSNIDAKVVVNIQADEPLVRASMIDCLVKPLLDDSSLNMTTLIKRIESKEELSDPNVVKVVTDKSGFALYFSRSPVPYSGLRSPDPPSVGARGRRSQPVFYKHIGLYAYTKEFLFRFTKLPPSPLEKKEKLEQLRVLENGYRIKALQTKYDTIGVDTPEDLERVRRKLRNQ